MNEAEVGDILREIMSILNSDRPDQVKLRMAFDVAKAAEARLDLIRLEGAA